MAEILAREDLGHVVAGLLREFVLEPVTCDLNGKPALVQAPAARAVAIGRAGVCVTDVDYLSGGDGYFCALEASGEVECWGYLPLGFGCGDSPWSLRVGARGIDVDDDWACADLGSEEKPTCWGSKGWTREDEPGVWFPFSGAQEPTMVSSARGKSRIQVVEVSP